MKPIVAKTLFVSFSFIEAMICVFIAFLLTGPLLKSIWPRIPVKTSMICMGIAFLVLYLGTRYMTRKIKGYLVENAEKAGNSDS